MLCFLAPRANPNGELGHVYFFSLKGRIRLLCRRRVFSEPAISRDLSGFFTTINANGLTLNQLRPNLSFNFPRTGRSISETGQVLRRTVGILAWIESYSFDSSSSQEI